MVLFRDEFQRSRDNRLYGDIIIKNSTATTALIVMLIAILIAGGIFLGMGSFARTETVSGIIVTDRPTAKIYPQFSGIVSEVVVDEGQLVQRGDKLLIINSDRQATEGGNVAGRNLSAIEGRRALANSQIQLISNELAAESIRLTNSIQSAEARAEILQNQIELQQAIVDSNDQMFDQLTSVVERGFVSKTEYESRRIELLSGQQALSELKQREADLLNQIRVAQMDLNLATIRADQRKAVVREAIEELSVEEAILQGEQSYTVSSPIAGRVTTLATGPGRSTAQDGPLMIIVPDQSNLEAALYAPSRAVGFVETGSEVRILYDAFPYQRYGSFNGEVRSISRVALDPKDLSISIPIEEPVYLIKVRLLDHESNIDTKSNRIHPGMTLQANLILERQSFIDWLLQPLNSVWRKNA